MQKSDCRISHPQSAGLEIFEAAIHSSLFHVEHSKHSRLVNLSLLILGTTYAAERFQVYFCSLTSAISNLQSEISSMFHVEHAAQGPVHSG